MIYKILNLTTNFLLQNSSQNVTFLYVKLFWLAIIIRSIYLLICGLSYVVFPKHVSQDAYFLEPENYQNLGSVAKFLTNWDGQFNAEILNSEGQIYAENEKFTVFFLGFPLLVNFLSTKLLNSETATLNHKILLGLFFNNFVFTPLASLQVYSLTTKIICTTQNSIRRRQTAIYAYLLFLINPASIFFTAFYTESLYAFLVFTGIHFWLSDNFLSGIAFFLAGFVRSNGIINAGFYGFNLLVILEKIYCHLYPKNEQKSPKFNKLELICHAVVNILAILCTLAPFVMVQMYHYLNFCQQNLSHQFCYKLNLYNLFNYPKSYSNLQRIYWENGLLAYWKIKNLHNFIIFVPLMLFMGGGFNFLKKLLKM